MQVGLENIDVLILSIVVLWLAGERTTQLVAAQCPPLLRSPHRPELGW